MELEKQVCSLELAKRLKELGVKQESYFAYQERMNGGYELMQRVGDQSIAAFTVAELGEKLPPYVEVGDSSIGEEVEVRTFTSDHSEGKWDVWYEGKDANGERCDWYYQTAPHEADARAKMLIYLIENKLITV